MNSIEEMLQERDAILDDLHYNLTRAQQILKSAANLKRRDDAFEVDDMVYLKLQPYRQRSLARKLNEKLAARFYGPFRIAAKVGKVAYRLELPETAKIHPVFHISQLKRSVGNATSHGSIPPQLTADLELMVEPEALLEVRQVKVGSATKLEGLIKWKNLPAFEATWEDVATVNLQFPTFHLEDKVAFWEGSNVMHQEARRPVITYSRNKSKGKKVTALKVN